VGQSLPPRQAGGQPFHPIYARPAEIDAGRGAPGALTTEEREELGRLRRENRTLRMERDILKTSGYGAGRPPAGPETRSAATLVGTPGAEGVCLMVTSRARKKMVRGWLADLTVVTPSGDPV
jgi:hypothetical protein